MRFLALAVACAVSLPSGGAAQSRVTGPLAELDALAGRTWTAQGSGFSTTLRYRWLFEGRLLEGTNEVRSARGEVIARYWGAYAWDAGRNRIEFWTAAESGELHRGHARWQDGVLWHDAEVSGGRIDGYRSAVRPRGAQLDYFAAYGAGRDTVNLLTTVPLVYSPSPR
jgi:hypothetical protein